MPRNPIDLPDPNPKTRGLIPGQEFDLALTRQPGSGQPKGWRAGPTLRIYKASCRDRMHVFVFEKSDSDVMNKIINDYKKILLISERFCIIIDEIHVNEFQDF